MFRHIFAVTNLSPSPNSHLWAQSHKRKWLWPLWEIDVQVQDPNPHKPQVHHPHFVNKGLKTSKILFCLCLLARQPPAQLIWTSQQLILIWLLKLCIALPTCLQKQPGKARVAHDGDWAAHKVQHLPSLSFKLNTFKVHLSFRGFKPLSLYLQREKEP